MQSQRPPETPKTAAKEKPEVESSSERLSVFEDFLQNLDLDNLDAPEDENPDEEDPKSKK